MKLLADLPGRDPQCPLRPQNRMTIPANELPLTLSIGIMAWNEEESIGPMLASLFTQTVFSRLSSRGEGCEVVCLANGCTDGTVAIARDAIATMGRQGGFPRGSSARVEDIATPGRNNAWNRFVHEFSGRGTRYICLMDADIIFNQPDTLELVVGALDADPHLGAASDSPVKDIALKGSPSLRERLSLATSDMTGTIEGKLNGMLYCVRSQIMRNLYLPRDLGANDDGFIKEAICTDFFRARADKSRVVSLAGATHLYQPYLSLADVLNNQKRQMIGQTTVYVAVEYLGTLPEPMLAHLFETLRHMDASDPDWLKRRVAAHVTRSRFFWRLFPGVLGFRWRRLARMRGIHRLTHFPAAAVGFFVTLVACWRASRFLRGGVSAYWPKTERKPILSVAGFSRGK
jgi:glycosyltransferase involved in cell wall biosynthesis